MTDQQTGTSDADLRAGLVRQLTDDKARDILFGKTQYERR